MKKVFLSYANIDSEAAKQLHASLRNADVSGWMDHADIASGEAVAHKIKESIREASAVVVLISPGSITSQWVQFEVGAAWAMGKLIVPVLIGDSDVSINLPDWLSEFQYLDARDRPLRDVAKEVVRIISDA